jgi:cation transport regulator ChaC
MDFLAMLGIEQLVAGNGVIQVVLKNIWEPLIPRVVVILVVFLALIFLIGYLWPSWWRIRRRLKAIIPRIQALKPKESDPPVDRHAVQEILAVDQTLKHLWAEYAETLHEQYDYFEGERRLVSIRATVPAEVFFNTQVLVDTPLNTEFFRHLPGILTGIGIIGTFSGLIAGLSGFEPTGSAEVVKASLSGLMEGVKEAFYASAVAITVAMLITFVEKSGLNRRYKQVEQLAQAIDALYEAGAGEEYLARLVKAAEESASQTRQLKQSLVNDLKDILTELTQQQIQANKDHGLELSKNLAQSIKMSLEGPLQQIADVVQTATGKQGDNVQNMGSFEFRVG